MKKIFIITLLLGIFLIGCSKELTNEYVLEDKVEVIPSGDLESTLTYPVVKDLADKKVEKKINNDISERVEGFKRGLETFKQTPEMENNTIKVDYDIGCKTEKILSIRLNLTLNMASFGTEDKVIMPKNYDLKTGESLELKDILKDGYKQELNPMIEARFSELQLETEKNFGGIDENTKYYLKDNSLVIFFDDPEYIEELGKPLDFEFPFNEIDNILKDPLAVERDTSPALDDYNLAINDKTKPFEALFFIRGNISKASLEDATTMILSFEEIQEKYIEIYEEVLIDNKIQEKLFEVFENTFDKSKIDKIGETDLEALLTDIIDGGYMIINLDGLFTIVQDYSSLVDYIEYLPDDIKDYIILKADESKDLQALGIGGNLSWEQIKDRIIKYENYMKTHPESIKEYVISKEHMYILHSYFFGFDGMPAFDYSTNKINDGLLQSYKEFISINEKSETAKIIEGYLEVLERNDYALCEEIEEYRRSFSSINEEYF